MGSVLGGRSKTGRPLSQQAGGLNFPVYRVNEKGVRYPRNTVDSNTFNCPLLLFAGVMEVALRGKDGTTMYPGSSN